MDEQIKLNQLNLLIPDPIAKVFPNSLSVENGRINIKMIDTRVIDILNLVSDKLDKKILINSQVEGKVSIQLTNATLDELLNLLSDSIDFSWVEKNGTIIISTGTYLTSPVFFPIKYANMTDIKTSLSILKLDNNITINYNPPGIIVNAPPNKLEQVDKLIQKLDCKTPSIKVEFMVLEINKTEERKLGISWQDVVGTYTHTSSYGETLTRVIGKGLTAGVVGTALETKNIGKILAKPYIITLNNIEAHLSTGDEVPIFGKDINGSPTVEYKKVGIELYTTPSVINFEEQLLKIKAKTVVNIISGKETQNNLTAPQISAREAETVMNITSGETIVIGGLLKESDIKGESGVPGLSQLPLIGKLFKISNTTKSKTEIVIFITPTLINEP